jgi:DNA-binding NtrC family response regulator
MFHETLRLPKAVLIVDNDQNLRQSLALILQRASYWVTTVGSACEALEHLEVGHYNIIILDSMMTDNRLTLLPTVQRLYPNIPILVFTARWSPETAVEIEQLGVRAHLVKPVNPKSLLECVNAILTEHPSKKEHVFKADDGSD